MHQRQIVVVCVSPGHFQYGYRVGHQRMRKDQRWSDEIWLDMGFSWFPINLPDIFGIKLEVLMFWLKLDELALVCSHFPDVWPDHPDPFTVLRQNYSWNSLYIPHKSSISDTFPPLADLPTIAQRTYTPTTSFGNIDTKVGLCWNLMMFGMKLHLILKVWPQVHDVWAERISKLWCGNNNVLT